MTTQISYVLCFCGMYLCLEMFVLMFMFLFTVIVPSTFEAIMYLLGYHLVFVTFMWSYWQTVFTPIGTVPRKVSLIKHMYSVFVIYNILRQLV